MGRSSERERKAAAEKVVERCGVFQFESGGTRLGVWDCLLHQSDVERDGMFMRDVCSSVEVLAVLKMRWTERLYDIYMVQQYCSYLSSSIHSDVMIAIDEEEACT